VWHRHALAGCASFSKEASIRKGSLITELPGTTGAHDIALAQKMGKGFSSNGGENTVTVFDLKTLKETTKIKLPDDAKNANAILCDGAVGGRHLGE
jgi:hypothetical protein